MVVSTERARSTSTLYKRRSLDSSPAGTLWRSATSAIDTNSPSRPCCGFDATSADSSTHAAS